MNIGMTVHNKIQCDEQNQNLIRDTVMHENYGTQL